MLSISHYRDTESFVTLLQTNFIIDLYNLRHPATLHAECRRCAEMRIISVQVLDTVSQIAESGYGRGELAHFLLTGEKAKQKHVAMVTSLIVRDPKSLYSLLFEHNALQIVMDEIFDESPGARSADACLGVTALAHNLSLCLESEVGAAEEQKVHTAQAEEKLDTSCIGLRDLRMRTDSRVTFVVENGDRVEFNEGILKSYSDVFNSMFSSDFQESKYKEVLIPGITSVGLKYFLQLVMHFHRNPVSSGEYDPKFIPKTEEITAALDAYELSIKYMLTEMEGCLLGQVKRLIDDGSVQRMFEWAMKNNNSEILEIAIYYYLNSDLAGPKKLKMFRTANASSYSKEWNFWIVDTIKTKCSNALGLLARTE